MVLRFQMWQILCKLYQVDGMYIVTIDLVYNSSCHIILYDTLIIGIADAVDDIHSKEPIIQISPNPFDENLFIQVFNVDHADNLNDIRILNIVGQILYSKHEENLYLKNKRCLIVPQLADGHYILEVMIDQKKYVLKVVKK